MKMLSKNFSLEEMLFSQTATRKGIKNVPSPSKIKNLTALCNECLQPLRDKIGVSIRVSSGFRCVRLNIIVGGTDGSQHPEGEAADINAEGYTAEELFHFILKNGIKFDQLILEFGQWVHISYKRNPAKNRGHVMIATKKNGKTCYSSYNINY